MYPDGVPPEIVARTAGKLGSHLVGCRLTAADRARANQRQRREAAEVYADLVEDMGR
ncbi:MAG: hypothetical protein JOZ53_18330 [Planctomycetaceae bacterium]|nr:hypothetical protein [Planctomycetaceae bacterium]